MKTRISLIVIGALIFAGCKDHSGHTALPQDHPANPDAPEVAFAIPADPLTQEVIAPAAVEEDADTDAHADHPAAEKKPATTGHDHKAKANPTGDKETPDEKEVVELSAEMQGHVDHLLGAYLALADMLAKDEYQGAAEKVTEIHKAGHALDDSNLTTIEELSGRITKAAHGKAGDLKTARATFKAISAPVVELARIAPPTKKIAETVREAYCPMVKASWLQTAEKVANPYYGSEMPRCGKITRTLKASDGGHDPERKHKD